MVLTQTLKEGAGSALRTWRATVLLYAVNAVLAGAAALVFRSGFDQIFGASMMPAGFMDGFDFPAYSQLGRYGGPLSVMMLVLMGWMVVLQMLAFACLGGGVIAAVGEDGRTMRVGEILRSGGAFAGRFLRVLLIEIAMLAVVGGLTTLVYGVIIGKVYSASVFETGLIRALYATSLIIVIPAGIILAVGDYARVIMVVRDERSSLKAVGQAFKFVFRNLLMVLALELLLVLAGLVLVGIFWGVDNSIAVTTGGVVFAVLVLQEVFVFLRMGVKVWNYGTAMSFWEIRESQHERTAGPARPAEVAPAVVPARPVQPPAVPAKVAQRKRRLRPSTVRRPVRRRPSTGTRRKRPR